MSGGDASMTKVGEVYLCEICGNKVKVLERGKARWSAADNP